MCWGPACILALGCLDCAGRECRTDSRVHVGLVFHHAQPPSKPISRLLWQSTCRISLRAQQEEEEEQRIEQCTVALLLL